MAALVLLFFSGISFYNFFIRKINFSIPRFLQVETATDRTMSHILSCLYIEVDSCKQKIGVVKSGNAIT